MASLLLATVILSLKGRPSDADKYEVRIYEGAAAGVKMTMCDNLKNRLLEHEDCFGQLEADVDWFRFSSEHRIFETVKRAPVTNEGSTWGTLHLLCAENTVHFIKFRVHVARRNRHPPLFMSSFYHFHVPIVLAKESVIGNVTVLDDDPIMYNAQIRLGIASTGDSPMIVRVAKTGAVYLIADIRHLPTYQPLQYQLIASDFGSPQFTTAAELTITLVTVSEVNDMKVNIATTDYQIFEWKRPTYGVAKKYKIIVFTESLTIFEKMVDGNWNMALLKVPLKLNNSYDVQIFAVDESGETPSQIIEFKAASIDITCKGVCSSGGRPVCYRTNFDNLVQYYDGDGPHCICYPGYSGPLCDTIVRCPSVLTVEAFGRIEWDSVPVNDTSIIPCPYGIEGDQLSRSCVWDRAYVRPIWQSISGDEVCRKQSSMLLHLGAIKNYAEKSVKVSGIETVHRFINALLRLPAFKPNITCVLFDTQIAEEAVEILDIISSRNWTDFPGNTTHIRDRFVTLILNFVRILPVPLALVSHQQSGLTMKTVDWLETGSNDTLPIMISRKCFVRQLIGTRRQLLRTVCFKRSRLFRHISPLTPILFLEMDDSTTETGPILIGLRLFTQDTNFTCVRLTDSDQSWSTAGIEVISYNKDSYVVCKTGQHGLYSLLPVKLFEKEDEIYDNFLILFVATCAFLTAVGCLFIFLISLSVWKRGGLVLSYMYLAMSGLHAAQFSCLLLLHHNFCAYMIHIIYFLLLTVAFTLCSLSLRNCRKVMRCYIATYDILRYAFKFLTLIVLPVAITVVMYFSSRNEGTKCAYKSWSLLMAINVIMPLVICALIIGRSSMLTVHCVVRENRTNPQNQGFVCSILRVAVCIPLLYILLLIDVFIYFHRFNPFLSTILILTHLFTSVGAIVLFLSIIMLQENITKSKKNSLRQSYRIARESTKHRLTNCEIETSRNGTNPHRYPHLETNLPKFYTDRVTHERFYQLGEPMVSDV